MIYVVYDPMLVLLIIYCPNSNFFIFILFVMPQLFLKLVFCIYELSYENAVERETKMSISGENLDVNL